MPTRCRRSRQAPDAEERLLLGVDVPPACLGARSDMLPETTPEVDLMRKTWSFLLLAALLTFAGTATAEQGTFDAQAAFDRLAEMAGTWTGGAKGEGEAEGEAEGGKDVEHTFQVSASGSVVMETMNPGTDHEMINMYHLDGDDLVLTHYCAGGNQPRMRIVPEKSSADRLVFDYDGGTNLDPATDGHIHGADLTFGDGFVDSVWIAYNAGEPAGEMAFHLTRVE